MRNAFVAVITLSAIACGQASNTAANEVPQVLIKGSDFRFEAPDTVPAGPLRITFQNDGPSFHHAQIVRVESDIPLEAIADSLGPTGAIPSWLVPVGGVEGADSVPRSITVSLVLSPGRYLLICRIITDDKRMHYSIGMLRPLIAVEGPENTGAVLESDVSFTLSDFAIAAPDSLPAGEHRFLVRNSGPTEHNLTVARLAPGRTLADVIAAPAGPTPVFEVLGGTAGLAAGEENVLHMSLDPGRYVLLCFVPDLSLGKEHYHLGMVRALEIFEEGPGT